MTDTDLHPLNKMFPVPLEGGIPSFWELAAEWRGRSPSLWDAETKRAARWANGPIPEGFEPRWTVFMPPPIGDWPPAVPPASNRPATVYAAPPPPPRLALEPPSGVTHETAALPAVPEPSQWPPSDDDQGDLLGFTAIWDEPERRPFLGRWRGRGAHQ